VTRPGRRPELIVAGSIALDTLEGPFGAVTDELGGSALYFSLAAGLIGPVRLLAPVGGDGVELVRRAVAGRDVSLEGLAVLEAPTYRWQARQLEGRNLDLGSHDSIYDAWQPELPAGFSGWAFVGSMRPDLQVRVARGLAGARLLAADAMRSYVAAQPEAARELLRLSDWYFCNHEEFAALGGQIRSPGGFRRSWGLDGLVVKAGPAGVTAYTEGGVLGVPALLSRKVVDTTGAGDTLAGGMLARWLNLEGEAGGLEDAMVHGVACASLAIEQVGVRGIAAATPETLAERVEEVWQCLRESRRSASSPET